MIRILYNCYLVIRIVDILIVDTTRTMRLFDMDQCYYIFGIYVLVYLLLRLSAHYSVLGPVLGPVLDLVLGPVLGLEPVQVPNLVPNLVYLRSVPCCDLLI